MPEKGISTVEKKGSKKGIIAVILALLVVAVAGVGYFVLGGSGSVKGMSDVSDVQYQYQKIDVGNIVVDMGFKGEVPLSDSGMMYTLSTPSYTAESYTVFINETPYDITISNFVRAESIEWLYDGKETIPYSTASGPLSDPTIFTGTITYEDGTVMDGTAEYAELSWDSPEIATVTIYMGGTTYMETFLAEDTPDSVNSTISTTSSTVNVDYSAHEGEGESEAGVEGYINTGDRNYDDPIDGMTQEEALEYVTALGFNSIEDYIAYQNGADLDYMSVSLKDVPAVIDEENSNEDGLGSLIDNNENNDQ